MDINSSDSASEYDLQAFFGRDGALAKCLSGFAPRPEQLIMAEAVARSLRHGRHLVVEAGTGTGKTLAYLVPALLSGQKIVLSTGTRTLQDQLFHRDLPTLGSALGRPVDVQLLKGRANYLCEYRLDLLRSEPDGSGQEPGYQALLDWAKRTESGDIAEASGVPEGSALWPRVTSTAENCLGSKCSRFDDCHVVAARKAARDADLVVVNHHLLMADLTMKEEGFGELLPGVDAVVVDEAHHFPDIAQAFFNVSVGSGQLEDMFDDIRRDAVDDGFFGADLQQALNAALSALGASANLLPAGDASLSWGDAGEAFQASMEALAESLEDLVASLSEIREGSAGLQRCFERATNHSQSLNVILGGDDDENLRWMRKGARRFRITLTPLDASEDLGTLLSARPCTWVFTSATLAVGEDFQHFRARLGMAELEERQIPSPFAYGEIARLYLPSGMPEPAADNYVEACVEAIVPVLEASQGRAFLLFTSHRSLQRAASLLSARDDFEFPLLVQGSAPRSRLLESFTRLGNAVLLGTATFWEGVDIRGHGLVLVAIDRLPFASPSDPMLAARLDAIRKRGGNPFRQYQLPQAVLSLKQGVGRLIRDYDDFGVIMICDPRITRKSYGRVFLRSLPPMQVIEDPGEARDFFIRHESLST